MTEKPMTVAEVANFLRRSIKSVKRLPIPFSRVGKGRLDCCVLLAMPVGNRLLSLAVHYGVSNFCNDAGYDGIAERVHCGG